MGTARGYMAEINIDFETAFGSDPGSPAALTMPINTCDLKATRSKNVPNTITGSRNPAEPFDGNKVIAGPIQVPVGYTAFAYWLKAMFGAPTTTGSGPYTHTFKITDSQPSLVIEKKFQDASSVITYAKYNGCKIDSFAMKIGGDGEVLADFSVAGADETISGTPLDATPTSQTLNRFNMFQATLSEGGSSLGIATELDFTVDFGLDKDNFVIGGSGIIGDLPEGLIRVTGNLTALFQNTTLLNKAVNGTESSLVVTFTSGTNSLAITFAELEYGQAMPGISGPKGILITLPFTAFYSNDSDASVVKAVLVNSNDGIDYA